MNKTQWYIALPERGRYALGLRGFGVCVFALTLSRARGSLVVWRKTSLGATWRSRFFAPYFLDDLLFVT